jgi:hypothetical protein
MLLKGVHITSGVSKEVAETPSALLTFIKQETGYAFIEIHYDEP